MAHFELNLSLTYLMIELIVEFSFDRCSLYYKTMCLKNKNQS
jgi:hypothetical protein